MFQVNTSIEDVVFGLQNLATIRVDQKRVGTGADPFGPQGPTIQIMSQKLVIQ